MRKQLFNLIVLVISLTSLIFSLVKVMPFSLAEEKYIGIIATFIGISVTLLIGYQIFNYLELRKELAELKEAKAELSETKKRIQLMEYESQEIFDIIFAKFLSKENSKCVEAFLVLQKALISSLKANREDFSNIFDYLKEFIINIEPKYTSVGPACDIPKIVDLYINEANNTDSQLKSLGNYFCIKYEYEHIMKCFYFRMDQLRKGEAVSEEERAEIFR